MLVMKLRQILLPLLVIVMLVGVDGLAIDNEVVGLPSVTCSENAIQFSVRTRNVFRGNIYIKGQYGSPQCRQEYFQNDFNGATFSVRISDCGMRRIRQLQPHGMNYMLVFVTNFHPQFVTKVDKAYNVRCFYAQADKTVTAGIDVSMLTTQSLEQSTLLMPNCEYSVREGQLNGPRVRYSQVGDRLVHRWECDNPNFGMLVKNCFVSDGSGSSVRILDSRGCPVFTPVIQGPLQYDTSLNLAYVEVWAYKFPDKPSLYFQCQIQICNKRDNECVGVTPPNCPRVLKNNFVPNSIVDPNTNPTNVRGTFGGNTGGIRGGIQPNVDPNRIGGVNPAVSSRGGIGAGGYPSSNLASGGIGSSVDRSGYNAQPSGYGGASPQIDPNRYSGRNRIGAGGGLGNQIDPNVYATNVGSGSQVDPTGTGGLQPARPYARDAAPLRANRQLAIDGSAKSNNGTATKSRVRRATSEIDITKFMTRQQAERMMKRDPVMEQEEEAEHADETFDIVAEPVFIADPEDIPEDDDSDKDAKQTTSSRFYPFATKTQRRFGQRRSHDHQPAVCLNRFGVGLVTSCFSLLIIVLCVALFYIVSQVRGGKRASDDSSSSVRLGAPPSRALGMKPVTTTSRQQRLWDSVKRSTGLRGTTDC